MGMKASEALAGLHLLLLLSLIMGREHDDYHRLSTRSSQLPINLAQNQPKENQC